jgi:hypothetical protein
MELDMHAMPLGHLHTPIPIMKERLFTLPPLRLFLKANVTFAFLS